MGFHLSEEEVVDGTIDNRIKDLTILRVNFTNHTSSLIRLKGNPCRDLAGSLWAFRNPHARMDKVPGEQYFFIPALCEGFAGNISYSKKRHVSDLPPDEYYDRLFDPEQEDPPTRMAPVLELEWFSHEFLQVEIDCAQITLELVEMVWSLSMEEAAEEMRLAKQIRTEIRMASMENLEDLEEDDEWMDEEEPHELEEHCFLIIQEFLFRFADGSDEANELHSDLLELQDQIGDAFAYFIYGRGFEEIDETISLLSGVLPFIDTAMASARFHAETTVENLADLKAGIVRLRDELKKTKRE